jgi:subtilisin family serine protease
VKRTLLALAIGSVLTVSSAATAQDQLRAERILPGNIDALKLNAPLHLTAATSPRLSPALSEAKGPTQVVVRLAMESVGEARAQGKSGNTLKSQKSKVNTQQAKLIKSLGKKANILGTADTAINAIMMEIDAAYLAEIASNPMVASVRPVVDFERDLTETVPYIGGTYVQEVLGFDGTGVTVAVLDSGIDYTHANFGGPGTRVAYKEAWGTRLGHPAQTKLKSSGRAHPDKKTWYETNIVGGYDFVGELWPVYGPLMPDEDPIDLDGHGTHVADIIGGINGVAPGVELYAVKVCSAVSSSCSGVALIRAMDYILDPDDDPATDDQVDIVNMSLGADYGHADFDDLTYAVEVASANGVLTVSSAGNGGDKPYKTGTPSAAPSALAVAQTAVPSAFQPFITIVEPPETAGDYEAVFQGWSVPLTSIVEAPVIWGDTDGDNALGCDPFDGDLSGYIVLVDRGACAFSVKITNIGNAGGEIGVIATVDSTPPFNGAFGGGNPTIPGYMVSKATGDKLKVGLPDIGLEGTTIAKFDPANGNPLVGTLASTSSRGPSLAGSIIKPEIGAPGASVSAQAGTGTGETPFGGTSGASPMVAGSAALLMSAHPDRNWAEIRAALVNNGETEIYTEFGSPLAPISRIGGGEVRVDRAAEAPIAVWESGSLMPTLSFGFQAVYQDTTLAKTLTVRNYSDGPVTVTPVAEFRYASDDTGAVSFNLPGPVSIAAGDTQEITVEMSIDADALPDWAFDSGSSGDDPEALTASEFDGYINFTLNGESDPVHLPWHVMPRKSGHVVPQDEALSGGFLTATTLDNSGENDVYVETFSLLMTDPNDVDPGGPGQQNPGADLAAVGLASIPVPAGFCSGNASYVILFAMSSYDPVTHAVAPIYNSVELDTDGDDEADYEVFNIDVSFFGPSFDLSDGRNVTAVQNLETGAVSAFFFAEHSSNSANVVNYICAEQIGLNAANEGLTISGVGHAVDLYYGSGINDTTDEFSFQLGLDRYIGVVDGVVGAGTAPALSGVPLEVADFGDSGTSETGVLLRYSHAPEGEEFDTIAVNQD